MLFPNIELYYIVIDIINGKTTEKTKSSNVDSKINLGIGISIPVSTFFGIVFVVCCWCARSEES